jgi:nitrite reductase/ring-hydroxylating ferredoxin subunit
MLRPGLLITGIFLLISCSKDNSSHIPEVFVDYHITLQEFQIKKNADGILLVGNQGVAGLIIYHRADGAYVAFDRCSSVNPEKKCVVAPDTGGLTVTDPCSEAKFSLYDGAPVKAPAQRSLKQYLVTVTSFEIVVTN